MLEQLKENLLAVVPFQEEEIHQIVNSFQIVTLARKEFFLQEGEVCHRVGFLTEGVIRSFLVYEGLEKTCYLTLKNNWIADLDSLGTGARSTKNLQALKPSTLYTIDHEDLVLLYHRFPTMERFGRLLMEQIAKLTIQLATSLAIHKPEDRYKQLLHAEPDIFQEVPQKYIANMLGMEPESLSRIRKRMAMQKA
ncbi:MAG: Crp/Fnr family transcriptional regulator [Bacteroidota bacterium]